MLIVVPDVGSLGATGPTAPSSNVRVDTGFGTSSSPALAAEPWGRVHAAWEDDRTGSGGIHYAVSSDHGASWQADRRLDSPIPGAVSYEPEVAVDLTRGGYNGSVYVVWQTSGVGAEDVGFERSPDGGATWSVGVVLDQGPGTAATYHPSIAVDGLGRVYVVWADNRDPTGLQVFLRRSSDAGGSWTPEVSLSRTGLQNLRPTVAAHGDAVYAAWISTDLTSRYAISLAASADGGVTWDTTDAIVRQLPESIRDFDISTGPDGDLHVVATTIDAAALQRIEYVHSDELGRAFSIPETVARSVVSSTLKDSRIAVLGPVVAVAWAVQAPGPAPPDYDVYYAWSSGGPWSAPIRVDDTDRNGNPADDASSQDRPAIAAGGAVLHFAWVDGRSGTFSDVYSSSAEWDQPLITEVRDSPDGEEFVELYGWGRTAVSMVGWSLEVDGATFDIGGLGAIPAGAYVTVGDSPSATLVLPIDLADEGSQIRLLAPGGGGDVAGFGRKGVAPDSGPSQSTGRYTDGLAYGRSWTWEARPTPGAASRVPPPMLGPRVVLNELMFNPSNPSTAFVELLYRGTAPAILTGITIVGDAVATLPPIDFSPQQRSYVVFAADAPGLFSSLDAAGDNVYLADATGRLWDEAGWSTPHQRNLAMGRVPEAKGSHDGFDDASSVAAGWVFDLPPSLPGMRIEPDQRGLGDLGNVVRYDLTVTNELRHSDDVELDVSSGPTGLRVDLVEADGVTPIIDTNGNGRPDLPDMAPLETRTLVALVSIPSTPPVGDTEVTKVFASAYSNAMIRANATLSTTTVPHIEPLKWADPTTIYVEGSPSPLVTETTVHLEIVGSGQAIEERFPQDTIFVVDSSGSMTAPPFSSDPTGMRIDAIKAYIGGMAATDRTAIVGFARDPDYAQDFGAWLVNDVSNGTPAHLTWMDAPGKLLMQGNAETMRFGNGGTNIEKALQIAHQELLPGYRPSPACADYPRPFPRPPAGGLSGHVWVEILLTDGLPSHPQTCTDDEVAVAAANRIRIFTIGLGDAADQTYLRDIATRTGGSYYRARTAGDLLAVYGEIATVVNRLAGYDGNVSDDIPMITDVVPAGVHVVPGTFLEPSTGNPRPPAWQGTSGGRTVLEWNVTQLQIGESWAVEYRVSTPRLGRVPVSAHPDARVTYLRWDNRSVTLPFPPVEVTVLEAPLLQVTYTITRAPERGSVVVDGQAYPAPASFVWTAGEVHTISVPIADGFGPTERDLFDRWDDGGGATHEITVGTVDARITAFFVPQVLPTVQLRGTDGTHTVAAQYSFRTQPTVTPDHSGTWSEWVDTGASLSFDALASGTGVTERWATNEDFSIAPWRPVSSGFSEVVVYVHQAVATIRTSGLALTARASVTYRTFGGPSSGRTWDTWSEWVDVGSPLLIENPLSISATERYASRDTSAWTVPGPFEAVVAYYHQWRVRVITVGLEAAHPTGLLAVEFGTPLAASPWPEWEDWVDDGGGVSLDAIVPVGSRERFITPDGTAWSIRSAETLTIRYAHEYKPSVSLVGTDANHTVSLTIRQAGGLVVLHRVYAGWTDWVGAGGRLEFSTSTDGTPTRYAIDPTNLDVTRAFDGAIRYAPQAPNLKPLISLVYVAVILGVAGVVAHRRPLDLSLLRRGAGPGTGRQSRLAPPRFRDADGLAAKTRSDRWMTFLRIGVPLASLEGVIGLLSLQTGFLRVPEEGTWLSTGLIVNTILLASAIAVDAIAHKRGYPPRPPSPASRTPPPRDGGRAR